MSAPVRANPRLQAFDSPRGLALLRDPLLNKGTAFTEQERDALGLRGFLPAHVFSMKAQAERVLVNLRSLPSDLAKYVALNELHDRNEALFFRVVADNIDEIQPLIADASPNCCATGLITQNLSSYRRRALPRPRRPRRQRHGHPGREAFAVFRLRRHPPGAVPAGGAGRRHQQRGVAERSLLYRQTRAPSERHRLRRVR